MMQATPLARHDLLWLHAGAGDELAARWRAAGNPADAQLLQDWVAQARPLVVSRQPDEVVAPWLAAGLPLPPAAGKRRLVLRVHEDWVARRTPALDLAAAASAAPPAWQPGLAALAALADNRGVPLRVYGSLAWQSLTGLAYLHAASDLDLLWDAGDAARRDVFCVELAGWSAHSGIALDGEMLLAPDCAVSWREWQRASAAAPYSIAAQVLVKRLRGARLIDRAAAACAADMQVLAC